MATTIATQLSYRDINGEIACLRAARRYHRNVPGYDNKSLRQSSRGHRRREEARRVLVAGGCAFHRGGGRRPDLPDLPAAGALGPLAEGLVVGLDKTFQVFW